MDIVSVIVGSLIATTTPTPMTNCTDYFLKSNKVIQLCEPNKIGKYAAYNKVVGHHDWIRLSNGADGGE